MPDWLWRILHPYPEMRSVIVNTKAGTSVKGVLYKHAGRYIIIRGAEMLSAMGKPGSKPVAVDGEALVPIADVDFIQVLR